MSKLLLVGGCGYIGSYLYPQLQRDGFEVDICDLTLRGNPGYPIRFAHDYALLTAEQLSDYTHVLWFAGHSSVASAMADPTGALRNNCLKLFELTQKLAPQARIIYASTASLYSCADRIPVPSMEEQLIFPRNNPYDISKFAFDYIAAGFVNDFVGLRMGTLCGHSPNLRRELIFNKMNLSALECGKVEVSNRQSYRSLLFLSDLYQVVRRCVEIEKVASGFINVASLSLSIGDIAERIAAHHQVGVIEHAGIPGYSFMLDVRKARHLFNLRFDEDFSGQCMAFTACERAMSSTRQRSCM